VASVRIRCLNVVSELRKQGFSVELFKPKKNNYSVVVFSKSYRLRDIESAEALKASGTHIVFDICDNHFVKDAERVARLRRMLQICDRCVVSSTALKSVVEENMGSEFETPVNVIADAVETKLSGPWWNLRSRFRAEIQLARLKSALATARGKPPFRFVWFGNYRGSHNSGLAHAAVLRHRLEALNAQYPVSLTIISNSRESFEQIFGDWVIPVHYLDWSAYTFFRAMRMNQVALIPIESNAFTKVKTNNRVLQSLYLGLGVVADGIESYQEFSGCTYLDAWEEGLYAYIKDRALLHEHIREGRAIIERNYSIEKIARQWLQLFMELAQPA
jgi:glycosyltransferase involved in cell wall biosynthesis